MPLNGKRKTERKGLNNLELGTKETWSVQGKCLLMLLENIIGLGADAKDEAKELLIGIRKILRNAERTIEQCMLSRQGNLLDQLNVLSAPRNVNLMRIMRIIPNLWKSFGSVLCAISTYIIDQNITVREQAGKLQVEMRCSDPLTKAVEMRRNDVSAIERWLTSNRKWQAGGKARFIYLPPGYNNDPYQIDDQTFADLKSSLIVLKTRPDNSEGNKVQAAERWAA
jgi:hypothetical protein